MDKNRYHNLKTSCKTNRVIIKHASAIHCSNSLSLLQRKISNVLLFHAYSTIQDQAEHKISIRELSDYLGYRSNDYQLLKNALKILISTVIEWNLVDDTTGKEDWTASSILASVNIKNAICTYAYSPRMRALFASPTMYGKINLAMQSQFTSSYGLALYENCVRYKGLSQTKEFSIEVFRKIMGVPDNTYKIFRDFKRRILDKAVEEVNTFSDMFIQAEVQRVGRKVVSVKFLLKERKPKKKLNCDVSPDIQHAITLNDSKSEEDKAQLIRHKLNNIYKINASAANAIIKKHGINKINQQMLNIETSEPYVKGSIKNLAGYLVDALKNDYVFDKSNEPIPQQSNKDEEIKFKEDQQKQELKLKKAYDDYVKLEVDKVFEELAVKESEKLIESFKQKLQSEKNHVILEKLKKNGTNNNLVKVFLKQFIFADYPELINNIMSYEAFIQSTGS